MITAPDITAAERFQIGEERRLRLQVTQQQAEINRLRASLRPVGE